MNPITFTGNVTLTNSTDNTNTLTVNNAGGVTFTGVLADGASRRHPDHQRHRHLSLTPPTAGNTYSGGTNLN